jgi:DNA-binding NarL/FixJ family response regulator
MDDDAVRVDEPGMEAQLPWLSAALEKFRELAPSQKTILGCLAAGMDIRTTATHLARSEHTIKSHTTAILNRLGVNSRLQAGIAGHHLVLRGELDLPRKRQLAVGQASHWPTAH